MAAVSKQVSSLDRLTGAEDDAVSAGCDQACDDVAVRLSRGFLCNTKAQLVIDDPMHLGAVSCARDEDPKPVSFELVAAEVLLHGERRP